jgi:hypothetical protein
MFAEDSNPTHEEATMAAVTTSRRELAHRANDGIEVWLYWEKVGDSLTLEVYDAKGDEFFQVDVPKDRAMDAFRHPFVYLPATDADELAGLIAA